MRIAIMWLRFGPYHIARLHGAAACAAERGDEIVGMEVAKYDDVYAWDLCSDASQFKRITVFPNHRYESLAARVIRREVTKCLDSLRPDAVGICGWSGPEARAAIAWCRRRPQARAIVMSETKEDDGPRFWWKEAIKSRVVRQCDSALVGGRMQADYLRKLGFPAERIFLGYDAVDNEYFEREARRVRQDAVGLRARFGLPDKYFFACTRFVKRKNVDGLLRAYASYRRDCGQDAWGLVIAGSGDESAGLRDLERSLGLEGVVWPGFVQYDQLPVYFGLASAFIHPASSEPWGLVVNEAAASGLPVLVSKTVGVRYELVEDGANGHLFDPSRVDDIARALNAIAGATPDRRAAMGARSVEIAGRWTPRHFGEQLFAAATLAHRGKTRAA